MSASRGEHAVNFNGNHFHLICIAVRELPAFFVFSARCTLAFGGGHNYTVNIGIFGGYFQMTLLHHPSPVFIAIRRALCVCVCSCVGARGCGTVGHISPRMHTHHSLHATIANSFDSHRRHQRHHRHRYISHIRFPTGTAQR